jgi:hypothetical protein
VLPRQSMMGDPHKRRGCQAPRLTGVIS